MDIDKNELQTVDKSDIVFICVKPHLLGLCAQQIRQSLPSASRDKDKVFVSVLAGATLSTLEEVRPIALIMYI